MKNYIPRNGLYGWGIGQWEIDQRIKKEIWGKWGKKALKSGYELLEGMEIT